MPDKRGGGGDDGFGAGDVHGVEEEVGEFGDEELEGPKVVEQLDEGDEEDDGGDDVEEEPAEAEGVGVGEEGGTFAGEAEEGFGEVGDEVEDVILRFFSILSIRSLFDGGGLTPALVRRTKTARTNCASMPTMTVCHLIILRFLDVAQKRKMKTASPKHDIARLARVLSAVSASTIDPTRMTATVPTAARGRRKREGIISTARWTTFFHTKAMGTRA